jgi:hypothetical protein
VNSVLPGSHLVRAESVDLPALLSDLRSLDGRHGPLESRADGTLVSNDNGYLDIAPSVIARLPNDRSGISLFIGGGGAFSMLPELKVAAAVFVDKNPFVGELNQLLAESILGSDTPQETLEAIKSKYRLGQYAVLRGLRDIYDDDDLDTMLFAWFRAEARSYGHYHWSSPDRFPRVKEALLDTPLVSVAADITSPGFASALGNVLNKHNQKITHANFTNVHAWVGAASMEFVRGLPFHPDTTILYSSHKGAVFGDWPKMTYATSTDEYLNGIQ